MPGVEHGLLPPALLCLGLADGTPSTLNAAEHIDPDADWGLYRPWADPFALLRTGAAPTLGERCTPYYHAEGGAVRLASTASINCGDGRYRCSVM